MPTRLARDSAYEAVQIIDANPMGSDYIQPLLAIENRLVFGAYDGKRYTTYTTDGLRVQELNTLDYGYLSPEPLFTPNSNGRGISRLDTIGFFVGDGPEGRSLFSTDGLDTQMLMPGVSGDFDYDVYRPPIAWHTNDYSIFEVGLALDGVVV